MVQFPAAKCCHQDKDRPLCLYICHLLDHEPEEDDAYGRRQSNKLDSGQVFVSSNIGLNDNADVDVILEGEVCEERNQKYDTLPIPLAIKQASLERFVLKLLVLLVKLEGGLSTKLPVGQLVLVAVSLLVVEAATLSDGAKGSHVSVCRASLVRRLLVVALGHAELGDLLHRIVPPHPAIVIRQSQVVVASGFALITWNLGVVLRVLGIHPISFIAWAIAIIVSVLTRRRRGRRHRLR